MSPKDSSILSMTGVARVGVFAALAFGINTPFLAIPNIELFSFSLFLSGLYLGKSGGIATALVAGVIFVFFNPNGAQPILAIGLVQLFGFLLFGFMGGLLRPAILKKDNIKITVALLLVSGLVLTFWYDLTTNLAFAYIFGPFWPALVAGLGFSIIHTVSNTIIFGVSGAVVQRIWKRIEYIMPPLAAF
ncbi:MAG: hypothetical protein JSW64_07660 [Candidatus Zixiibacteriota bacterium]|nr:MAG: hypothetical protein JSW64_07660 [candidate division Zixibacteria bacterium]